MSIGPNPQIMMQQAPRKQAPRKQTLQTQLPKQNISFQDNKEFLKEAGMSSQGSSFLAKTVKVILGAAVVAGGIFGASKLHMNVAEDAGAVTKFFKGTLNTIGDSAKYIVDRTKALFAKTPVPAPGSEKNLSDSAKTIASETKTPVPAPESVKNLSDSAKTIASETKTPVPAPESVKNLSDSAKTIASETKTPVPAPESVKK